MKKYLTMILSYLLVFVLVGCQRNQGSSLSEKTQLSLTDIVAAIEDRQIDVQVVYNVPRFPKYDQVSMNQSSFEKRILFDDQYYHSLCAQMKVDQEAIHDLRSVDEAFFSELKTYLNDMEFVETKDQLNFDVNQQVFVIESDKLDTSVVFYLDDVVKFTSQDQTTYYYVSDYHLEKLLTILQTYHEKIVQVDLGCRE